MVAGSIGIYSFMLREMKMNKTKAAQTIEQLIQAKGPQTVQQIEHEIIVQTDCFDGLDAINRELYLSEILTEMITSDAIRFDVSLMDYVIYFDIV